MPPQRQPSLKELVKKAVADAKRLTNAQVALTKQEMNATGMQVGKGAGLGIATMLIAFFATLFLLVTLALGIWQMGLQPWLAFLIVAVLLLIVGAITGLLAKKEFEEIKPLNLTQAEFEKTKAALSGQPIVDATTLPMIDTPALPDALPGS
jgi:uncharacterized membrane protein YqjE